jgi:hypothetical protein
MAMLTTSAVARSGAVSIAARPAGPRAAQLIGLAIASILPAVFWSALIKVALTWFGLPLSPLAVTVLCVSIALFLTIACAPLILRRDI